MDISGKESEERLSSALSLFNVNITDGVNVYCKWLGH